MILTDFFDTKPGLTLDVEIPGLADSLTIPQEFDAVVGNPPYISYRHQKNLPKVIRALADHHSAVQLPKFSGKSDAYVWFLVHATQFMREGGRLGFVVSSAILFSDYGVPLIRFLGRHFRILAVVDSMVERWFPDADTNTVLLLLERCSDAEERETADIRFVRLRRPLAQLFPGPEQEGRRQALEDLVDSILTGPTGEEDRAG